MSKRYLITPIYKMNCKHDYCYTYSAYSISKIVIERENNMRIKSTTITLTT